jgi:VWFA-related protein
MNPRDDWKRRLLSLGAVALLPWGPPSQQDGDVQLRITQVDRGAFPQIRVYLSATDSAGEPVPVPAEALRLSEDGRMVEPDSIVGAGEVGPLTTMLVIDVSGSMNVAGKLEAAKAAARAYVDQMQPGDRSGVIAFDVEVEVVQPATEDRRALLRAIDGLQTGGDTALYDALVAGIRQLESIGGRRAILVLTDGMDNSSRATLAATLAAVGAGELSISAVGLGERGQLGVSFAGLNEDRLQELAAGAGGVYLRAADAAELRSAYRRLGRALHSEYVIVYTSLRPLRDGVNRTLEVRLETGAASASRSYNPGGVVPEVARAAPWSLFALVLAALVGLLLLPGAIRLGLDAAARLPRPSRPVPTSTRRVRLHDPSPPAERGRIRLH